MLMMYITSRLPSFWKFNEMSIFRVLGFLGSRVVLLELIGVLEDVVYVYNLGAEQFCNQVFRT